MAGDDRTAFLFIYLFIFSEITTILCAHAQLCVYDGMVRMFMSELAICSKGVTQFHFCMYLSVSACVSTVVPMSVSHTFSVSLSTRKAGPTNL